jgi:hypothetical protein
MDAIAICLNDAILAGAFAQRQRCLSDSRGRAETTHAARPAEGGLKAGSALWRRRQDQPLKERRLGSLYDTASSPTRCTGRCEGIILGRELGQASGKCAGEGGWWRVLKQRHGSGGPSVPFQVLADAPAERGEQGQSLRYCAELAGSSGSHRGMPQWRSQAVLLAGLLPLESMGRSRRLTPRFSA